MVKTYNIEYLFTGGERHLQTENIQVFAAYLDDILINEHTIQGTIKIYTEEIPVRPVAPDPTPKPFQ